MSVPSKTSRRRTSKYTTMSTSSPASEAGRSPSISQDGQTTDLFGPRAAPAHHSRLQAGSKSAQLAKARSLCGALDELATQYARSADTRGWPTSVTYGRKSGDSRPSAVLCAALGNRLRARLEGIGSPLYRLRWKYLDTLLGLRISALLASGHRTSGSDSSGWQTPKDSDKFTRTQDGAIKEVGRRGLGLNSTLGATAALAGWPTPDAAALNVGADLETHLKRVAKLKAKGINGNGAGLPLGIVSQMAGWPTPNVPNGGRSISHAEQKGGTFYHKGKKVQFGLEGAAKMAGRATPTSNHNHRSEEFRNGRTQLNAEEALGMTAFSSHAQTGSSGPRPTLNPAFSRWLMGFPPAWDACAPTATRSSLKSRQSS